MSYGTQREAPSQSRRQPAMLHWSVTGQISGVLLGQRVLFDTSVFLAPSVGAALAPGAGADAGILTVQPGSLYELTGMLTQVDFNTTGRVTVRWALADSPFSVIGSPAGVDKGDPNLVAAGSALAFFDARSLLVPTRLLLRFVSTTTGTVDSLDAVATVREL